MPWSPVERGLAETGGHAGQVLQFEDDVFEDVPGPGAGVQAFDETAALAHAAAVLDQTRQHAGETLGEAGKGIGRTFFEFAEVEPYFDHGAVSPDVRTAQVGHPEEGDIVLHCHVIIFLPPAPHTHNFGITYMDRLPATLPDSGKCIAHMLYTC